MPDFNDIAARFDISTDEAERISGTVSIESEFVKVWENEEWWTDENNA